MPSGSTRSWWTSWTRSRLRADRGEDLPSSGCRRRPPGCGRGLLPAAVLLCALFLPRFAQETPTPDPLLLTHPVAAAPLACGGEFLVFQAEVGAAGVAGVVKNYNPLAKTAEIFKDTLNVGAFFAVQLQEVFVMECLQGPVHTPALLFQEFQVLVLIVGKGKEDYRRRH